MELGAKQTTAEFWKSYFAKFRRPMDGDAAQATPLTDAPPEARRMRRQRVTLASRQAPATPETPASHETQER